MEVTKATVRFTGGMQFVGTGGTSEQTAIMDAAPEAGGQNTGSRPMEMLLFGLGGCTGMDVVSILSKKRQQFTGLEMNIAGDRSPDNPKRYTAINVEYVVRGKGLDPKAVADAIRLSEEKVLLGPGLLQLPRHQHASYRRGLAIGQPSR